VSRLAPFFADVLTGDAPELHARWRRQARAVAPRSPERSSSIDDDQSEPLVHAVASALRGDAHAHDTVVRAGRDYAAGVYAAGMSLHQMLKELDLLSTMVLYAGERALVGRPPSGATAADGVGVARSVQQIFALLTLSACKGFTDAYLARLRDSYRDLRHDLRNPLGTIENAVSLMEDESLPPELRASPRYRAMVTRNARSIDALISDRLGDASTLTPDFGRQEVSLRDVALAVRRDLRDEARRKGCEVVVDAALPTVLVDAASFELALRSVVAAALARAHRGTPVAVSLRAEQPRSAVVAVTFRPADDETRGGAPRVSSLETAHELLEHAGGQLWSEAGGWYLEVAVSRSAAHASHDVARAG
jgi:signal transduction histidine kinase